MPVLTEAGVFDDEDEGVWWLAAAIEVEDVLTEVGGTE